MNKTEALAHLEQMIRELTEQLVEEKLLWDTCRSSAKDALQLTEHNSIQQISKKNKQVLDELKEKLTRVLNFIPGEDISKAEAMQYKRYHMIVVLDAIKKLSDFLKESSSA